MGAAVTKQILDGAQVARRAMLPGETDAMLRSMLHTSDEGILLTDLDHRTLACNSKFGEVFELDPNLIVTLEPEAVRELVYPKLADPAEWRQQLMELYDDPMRVYSDEIELLTSPPKVIRRRTCPVLDPKGEITARLWTFFDITSERKRDRIREALHKMSTFQDPDPAKVMQRLVEGIAEFYEGAIALLSLRNGNRLDFRFAAGMPEPYRHITYNTMKDSYCRAALRSAAPLLVQDGSKEAAFKHILPVQMGLTRYVGAPIFDGARRPIGTICMIDGKSQIPADEDDLQFMSLIAMRISAELERERMVNERLAEQNAVVDRQRADLETTHQVLSAMNAAFQLLGAFRDTEDIVKEQVRLLPGVLGYDAAAILLLEGDSLEGFVAGEGEPKRLRFKASDDALASQTLSLATIRPDEPMRFQRANGGVLGQALGCAFIGLAPIGAHDQPIALLALGSHSPTEFEELRHRTHLEAIVDQVSLLLASHVLQRKLMQTHDELRRTQDRLVQSEKLSIVGTLAASIAHDIRNILASLKFDLAAQHEDPEETREAVKVQIDRFNLLAHRLLSYARPRTVSREEWVIEDLIERVVEVTQAQAQIAGVDIVLEFSGQHRLVADGHQVEHMFVNLILNAIQAMDSRGGTLHIRSEATGDSLRISFEDTGKGISPERIGKLFGAFFSTRSEGFGLGLFSVKRVVDEHGWAIRVDSRLGQGTTFHIDIPYKEVQNGKP